MDKKMQYLKIEIFSRLDLSSKEALQIRDMKLAPEQESHLSQETTFYSEASDRLLTFMAKYDTGFFCPEKCDVYEPIREIFDPNDLSEPIQWLSQPSGCVNLKKTRPFSYTGFIENHRFSNHWIDNNKIPEPRRPDPVFLTEWCLWIHTKILKLKGMEYLIEFFKELFTVSQGEYGFLAMEDEYKKKNFLITKEKTGTLERFVGDNLERSLPGIYWANIFGNNYVNWFGRSKFKSLPCHHEEELSDGGYLILSAQDPSLYNEVETQISEKVITDYLGRGAFFDIENPDRICNVPVFKNW